MKKVYHICLVTEIVFKDGAEHLDYLLQKSFRYCRHEIDVVESFYK